ncbi:MAG: hypothetical protein KC635_23900, partial [Myxococcales bacterium]|nr:hypothetical protein [Myxococcales bacterium]
MSENRPPDVTPPPAAPTPRAPRPAAVDWYADNPLVVADRRLANGPTPWVRSFGCEDVRPLIVCRGPIRKEA